MPNGSVEVVGLDNTSYPDGWVPSSDTGFWGTPASGDYEGTRAIRLDSSCGQVYSPRAVWLHPSTASPRWLRVRWIDTGVGSGLAGSPTLGAQFEDADGALVGSLVSFKNSAGGAFAWSPGGEQTAFVKPADIPSGAVYVRIYWDYPVISGTLGVVIDALRLDVVDALVVSSLQLWDAAGGVLGSVAINPMIAVGDLIRGGTSGAVTRLAIGTNGFFLKAATGVPTWAAFVNADLPTNIDVAGTFSVAGSILKRLTLDPSVKTANFTADTVNTLYLFTNSPTISLPTAVGITGALYAFVNKGAGTGTIDPFSTQVIGNVTTWALPSGDCILIVSDGANWRVLALGYEAKAAHTFAGGPTSGGVAPPVYRLLDVSDLPSLADPTSLVLGDWSSVSIGTDGQVLTVVSGAPAWADAPGPPAPVDTSTSPSVTLDFTAQQWEADASGSSVTYTLPPAASAPVGWQYTLKAYNNGSNLDITPDGSETIDGSAPLSLTMVGACVVIAPTADQGHRPGWIIVSQYLS